MKLLNEKNKIELFKNDIVIDNNLEKYSKLLKKKEQKKDEELIDLPDGSGELIKTETVNKNIRDNISVIDFKKYIATETSEEFNILISEHLFNLMKNKTGGLNINLNTNILTLNSTVDGNNAEIGSNSSSKKKSRSIWKRLFQPSLKKEEEELFELDVIELFQEIKVIAGGEQEFIVKVKSYVELIEKARLLGQIAQEEELISNLIIHVYESVLSGAGFNRSITFNELVELQMKCERSLDLDYVKNFIRVIPDEVAKRKILADKLCIFDNYVVLHYDPTGKNFKNTKAEEKEIEKEKERKKDPILFGIIKGSEKLYYIGDWVDEFCDLTWEQVAEKLNKE